MVLVFRNILVRSKIGPPSKEQLFQKRKFTFVVVVTSRQLKKGFI